MIDDILTPREKEVIHLICKGYDNQQIINALSIKRSTLGTHLVNLYQKFLLSTESKESCHTKRVRLALSYIKTHRYLLDELDF